MLFKLPNLWEFFWAILGNKCTWPVLIGWEVPLSRPHPVPLFFLVLPASGTHPRFFILPTTPPELSLLEISQKKGELFQAEGTVTEIVRRVGRN